MQKLKARHILELTAAERKEFIDSFDIVLSDCDGVIWLLVGPIPDTGTAINLLKSIGKQYKFISNNSMRTDQEYLDKLHEIGVTDAIEDDVVHPAKTIARYLKQHKKDQKVFSISSKMFNDSLKNAGIEVQTMTPAFDWDHTKLANMLKSQESIGAVVLDLNYNLTFGELSKAHQLLLKADCDFIVGASDAFIPLQKDLVTIGTEGFIRMLSETTGRQPIVLGKPGALLGKFLVEHFQISNPKRALFFGDVLVQDIQFGISCGFQTLLVLSGATTKEQMLSLPDELSPDYYADSIADFIKII